MGQVHTPLNMMIILISMCKPVPRSAVSNRTPSRNGTNGTKPLKTEPATVVVTVVDALNKPLNQVPVTLYFGSETVTNATNYAGQAKFTQKLNASQKVIAVVKKSVNFSGNRTNATLIAGVNQLRIVVTKAKETATATLVVTVVDPSNKPVQAIQVSLWSGTTQKKLITSAAGIVTFTNLTANSSASIMVKGSDPVKVTLVKGENKKTVNIKSAGDAATISVIVVDNENKPVPNIQVQVIATNKTGKQTTNAQGQAEFTGFLSNRKALIFVTQTQLYGGNKTNVSLQKGANQARLVLTKRSVTSPATLAVTLVDTTNKPAPDVEVIVVCQNKTQKQKSNAQGLVHFSNLTSTFKAGIFIRNSTAYNGAQAIITLEKGENKKQLTLVAKNKPNVTDPADLSVSVVDDKEQPVPNIAVQVVTSNKTVKLVTNAQGKAEFKNLTASKKALAFVGQTAEYTGATNNLTLQKGPNSIKLSIKKRATTSPATLAVTLVDTTNKPAHDVEVIVVCQNKTQKQKSNAQGVAQFSNLTSTYKVGIFVRNSTAYNSAQAIITLEKGENKKQLTLLAKIDPNKTESAELQVVVKSKDKKPVPNANITVIQNKKSIKGTTKEDGTSRFTNLSVGNVVVFIKANSSYNTKSVSVVLKKGSNNAAVELGSSTDPKDFTTIVIEVQEKTSKKPVPNMSVKLTSEGYNTWKYTNAEGKAMFNSTNVTDKAKIQIIVYGTNYTSTNDTVVITRGKSNNKTLYVEPKQNNTNKVGMITVIVVEKENGKAVPNASVALQAQKTNISKITDEKGQIQFSDTLIKVGDNVTIILASALEYKGVRETFKATKNPMTKTIKIVRANLTDMAVSIKFQDENSSKPITNLSISVKCGKKMNKNFTTDAAGQVRFTEKLAQNDTLTIKTTQNSDYKAYTFALNLKEKPYTGTYKMKQIESKIKTTIQVIDSNTSKPVPDLKFQVICKERKFMKSISSDKNGTLTVFSDANNKLQENDVVTIMLVEDKKYKNIITNISLKNGMSTEQIRVTTRTQSDSKIAVTVTDRKTSKGIPDIQFSVSYEEPRTKTLIEIARPTTNSTGQLILHADSSNHMQPNDTIYFILKNHTEYADIKKAIKIVATTKFIKFSLQKRSEKSLTLTINANTGEKCVESSVVIKTNSSTFAGKTKNCTVKFGATETDNKLKMNETYKYTISAKNFSVATGEVIQKVKNEVLNVTLNKSDPNNPDPVNPDPVNPDPVNPDPVNPDPVNPDPVNPDPVNPDPVNPDPVNPDPVIPDPDPPCPDPVNPDPVNPDPVNPDPVNPDPVNPDPVNPDPVNPDPVNPDPVNPDPVNPDPDPPAPVMSNISVTYQLIDNQFFTDISQIVGTLVQEKTQINATSDKTGAIRFDSTPEKPLVNGSDANVTFTDSRFANFSETITLDEHVEMQGVLEPYLAIKLTFTNATGDSVSGISVVLKLGTVVVFNEDTDEEGNVVVFLPKHFMGSGDNNYQMVASDPLGAYGYEELVIKVPAGEKKYEETFQLESRDAPPE